MNAMKHKSKRKSNAHSTLILRVRNQIRFKSKGTLILNNTHFKCQLGKSGIGIKKREGDHITPIGTYPIQKLLYRRDNIQKPYSILKSQQIRPSDGWCDDPKSQHYNRKILLPKTISHEKLYRKDHVYDLVLVIGYNIHPRTLGKGSAIFIHLSNKKYGPTAGCIALSKNALLKILKRLKPKSLIKILR